MSKTARDVIGNAVLDLKVREGTCSEATDFILQALREEGYRVVPVEPTEKMCLAGGVAMSGDLMPTGNMRLPLDGWAAYYCHRAMISAADGE